MIKLENVSCERRAGKWHFSDVMVTVGHKESRMSHDKLQRTVHLEKIKI